MQGWGIDRRGFDSTWENDAESPGAIMACTVE